MSKKTTKPTPMTPTRARAIQANADKTSGNAGFKARAARAAAKNTGSKNAKPPKKG